MTYENINLHSKLKSRTEAAEFLNIEPQTLASWACNGRYGLPFVKIGRRVMYRVTDLQAFIERNTVGGEVLQ